MIEKIITHILSLPVEMKISFGAFMVSLYSLYISKQSQKISNTLKATEKKTELTLKILNAKSNLERALIKTEETYVVAKDCGESKSKELISRLQSTIKNFEELYIRLEDKNVSNPIKVEKIMPRANKTLIESDNILEDSKDLLEICSKCERKTMDKDDPRNNNNLSG